MSYELISIDYSEPCPCGRGVINYGTEMNDWNQIRDGSEVDCWYCNIYEPFRNIANKKVINILDTWDDGLLKEFVDLFLINRSYTQSVNKEDVSVFLSWYLNTYGLIPSNMKSLKNVFDNCKDIINEEKLKLQRRRFYVDNVNSGYCDLINIYPMLNIKEELYQKNENMFFFWYKLNDEKLLLDFLNIYPKFDMGIYAQEVETINKLMKEIESLVSFKTDNLIKLDSRIYRFCRIVCIKYDVDFLFDCLDELKKKKSVKEVSEKYKEVIRKYKSIFQDSHLYNVSYGIEVALNYFYEFNQIKELIKQYYNRYSQLVNKILFGHFYIEYLENRRLAYLEYLKNNYLSVDFNKDESLKLNYSKCKDNIWRFDNLARKGFYNSKKIKGLEILLSDNSILPNLIEDNIPLRAELFDICEIKKPEKFVNKVVEPLIKEGYYNNRYENKGSVFEL